MRSVFTRPHFFLSLSSFAQLSFSAVLLSANLAAADFKNEHLIPTFQRLTDQTSGVLLLAGTATTLLAQQQDDEIRQEWRNHQKMSESNAELGDFLGTGIPSIGIAMGQSLFGSSAANSHWRALALSTMTSSVVKVSFGRPRPGEGSNHLSFPSGHTSISFASATSLTMSYGWQWGLIAYPVAAFIGMSRVSADVHWFSDVMGGAFVGILCGRAATYDETSLKRESVSAGTAKSSSRPFVVLPIASSRGYGFLVQSFF